jgi:hypothetical protein
MTEEMKQDTAQENPSNAVENKQESGSDPSLLQEIMAKKAKIKEQDAIIADFKSKEEKRTQKTMEEQGQYKELIAELKSTNEKQAARIERADKIETQLKVDIINSITSDEAKREELATKDLDTLRFIQNEVDNKATNNPQVSLGSVRVQNTMKNKDWTKMDERERRENWTDIVNSYKK